MNELLNIKAIITGGSSGIGQAIALAFAQAGADIVIGFHNNQDGAEKTMAAIKSLGRKAKALYSNLSNDQGLPAFMETALTFLGGIDVLVNNAGTLTRHANFLQIPLQALDHVYAVNLKAPFILTQLAANSMQKQGHGGSIINISSISTNVISTGLTHYECSKAALNMLTKSSASALAHYQIRVNAIEPGLVETNMNQAQRDTDYETWTMRKSVIPLGRIGQPQDIAHVAKLLASDKSSWMTGAIIRVDGGISIKS